MQQQNKKPTLTTLKILWSALLMSQFMFGAYLYIVISKSSEMTGKPIPFVVPALGCLAVVAFALAIFIPRFTLQQQKLLMQDKFSAQDLSKIDLDELIAVFFTPLILRLAMFESVTLFGFFLAFLHKDIAFFIPFATVSAAAFLFNFPREEKIREAFKR